MTQFVLLVLGKIFEFIEHNDKIIGALTGVAVAAFTGTLWWSTRRLWRVTNKTLRHSEQTAERQLRAYISVVKARFSDVEIGKRPKAKVTIRNSGQTPAFDLTANMLFANGPRDAPESQFSVIHAKIKEQSRMSIGPNQKFKLNLTKDDAISPDEMAAINTGLSAIYVIGNINYIDAFKNPRPATFRLMCTRDSIARGDGLLDVCENGNKYS
jgi:hypothetical protein